MRRKDMLAIPVRLVRDQTINKRYIPGYPYETIDYPKGEEFTVEHDFRNSEDAGIRVGCPDGSWISLTTEQFEKMFGSDALAMLDSIRYDEEGGDA